MNKTLVILAALLVPASALHAQNWDADRDRLVAEFRQKRYEEVLKLSSAMLVTYELPEFVGEIYTRRAGALGELKRWDDLVAEAGRLDGAAWAADRRVLADVLLRFAGALRRGKEIPRAIDVYRLVLAKCPKQTPQCATARVAVGDCYAYDLKDALEQAVPEYLAVEKDYPGEKPAAALAVQHLAETWWRLGDFRKAKDAYARALARYRADYPASHVEQFATRIGEACVRLDDPEGALKAYREAEETFTTRPEHQSELAWRRAKILFDGKRYAEAAAAYRRVVARYALANESRSVGSAQAVVDCFAALEKYDEALKAAHVVYDYGDRHWAVPKIIELLTLSGADDEQVEAFVRFQLYGPKGEDGQQEIANPFDRIGYPD
ncbi:MAG TPA: tetratricopeptide repeat protein, partial [Planctomycetota bacterium]|nr:tetratricopeptide repeat protein [Planctomycetota bacterium]